MSRHLQTEGWWLGPLRGNRCTLRVSHSVRCLSPCFDVQAPSPLRWQRFWYLTVFSVLAPSWRGSLHQSQDAKCRPAAMWLLDASCKVHTLAAQAVYGVVVEILAYWNVFLRGNHFECPVTGWCMIIEIDRGISWTASFIVRYVTASKALDRKSPYGAVECAKAYHLVN